MNTNKFMMGVDIGTTNTKAVLYKETGEVVLERHQGYTLHTPTINTAELNPDEIFQAMLTVVQEVMDLSAIRADDLSFISFSSAMHSLIAMDERDTPITNCLTWADNRSAYWSEKIKQDYDGLQIYQRTGTPIHPMSPLSKIMWLENEHPDIAERTKKYIGIKAYIFFKLFQRYVVDHSLASCSGLMNLEQLDWDHQALKAAGISKEKLGQLVSTQEIFSDCDVTYASEMGIKPDTPFVIGASDGVLSNIGVNAIHSDEIAVTIGTSGAIRTVLREPRTDPNGRLFCYALTENHWVVGGPVNNGGIVLQWLADELAREEVASAKQADEDPYHVLLERAGQVSAGANGLLFHPYLSGERAPLWDANARGSFIGLTLNHQKEHMIRAVLEGVIFNIYSVYKALTDVMDAIPKTLKATGGFAKSDLWRQILADVFEQDVIVPQSHESSCLGACVLGLLAQGKVTSLEAVTDMVGEVEHHKPNADNKTIYRALTEQYSRLSQVLAPEYEHIASLQSKMEQA